MSMAMSWHVARMLEEYSVADRCSNFNTLCGWKKRELDLLVFAMWPWRAQNLESQGCTHSCNTGQNLHQGHPEIGSTRHPRNWCRP